MRFKRPHVCILLVYSSVQLQPSFTPPAGRILVLGFTFLLHRHSGGQAVNKHSSAPTQHRAVTGNILCVRVFCPTPSLRRNPWRIPGLYSSVTSAALSCLAYRPLFLYGRQQKWQKWSRQGRPRTRKSVLIQKNSLKLKEAALNFVSFIHHSCL